VIVAVTGLSTSSNPEAGFGVLKSLKNVTHRDFRLVGLAYQPMETGLFHPGLMDRAFIVPAPRIDREAFIGRVGQIKNETGLDIIIPNIDDEIEAFASMADELGAMGVATLLPGRPALREMQSAINRQRTTQDFSAEEDDNHDAMVLPSTLVKNPVSERISPENKISDFYALAVLANRKSKVIALSAVKKILISRYGGTWMALTVDAGEFAALAENLVKDASWQGPLTIEVTRSRRGEQYISGARPVFPDWINLARAAGANLPAMLVDVIRGRVVKGVVQAAPGKVLIRSSLDVVTDLNNFGKISLNGGIDYARN